jgi:hypothetical protein
MSTFLDPRSPVAAVFFLRAGVHPLVAPEVPKPERCRQQPTTWREEAPPAQVTLQETSRVTPRVLIPTDR